MKGRLLFALLLTMALVIGGSTFSPQVYAQTAGSAAISTPTLTTTASSGTSAVLALDGKYSNCTVVALTSTGTATITVFGNPTVNQYGPGGFSLPNTNFGANGAITATTTLTSTPGNVANLPVGFYFTWTGNTGTLTVWATCTSAIARAVGSPPPPSSIPTSPTQNNYVIAQQSVTPVAQPGNDSLQGFTIATSAVAPSLAMMSPGDFLSSESLTKGRWWSGTAATGSANGAFYVALTEIQAALGLGPQAGDVLTMNINAHPIVYTVLAGDSTMAILANSLAAAVNADGTSSAIVTAVGSTSGTLGIVTLTAKTAGICCRYALSSSVSGGSQETLNSYALMDVPDYYIDEGKNVVGWSLATDLGDYTFDHSGNFQGPAGHNLNIRQGAGASSAITFNLNNPGNYNGIAIYDGTSNVNHADLLYPMNVHIITGPLEAEICVYTANNCTAAPTNPGYTGEFVNVNGSTTGPTQHEVSSFCTAATSCTINFGVAWTSATSYSCQVTAEGAADDAHIVPASKTASSIQFAGSTSVVRDFQCAGI